MAMNSPRRPPREAPLARRRAGLLVPVFAMRHAEDLGVGDTRAVREAIDFCAEHGFEVLQLLPIQETFGDHSPYSPISSQALSPTTVHLHPAEVPGLEMEDIDRAAPPSWREELRQGRVKQGSVHALKSQILLRAWERFSQQRPGDEFSAFRAFQEQQASWLGKYTLYRLLIREYEGFTDWRFWRPDHRSESGALEWLESHPERDSLERLRQGYAFLQWVVHRQWQAVRARADECGVYLMGEISFGVGAGSADVWGWPELFDLEWTMGTQPLAHFDTSKEAEVWGQNWGLPAYRWENHRNSGFSWLRARVARQREFFHLCRLDHLRGYFRIYMFPWPGGARHAEFSTLTPDEAALRTGGKLPRYLPGPDGDPACAQINEAQGRELITVIREAAGPMDLVAEIMGEMPDYMSRTLEELPLANLAFPQLERRPGRDPAKIELREWALATYANHDNAPLAASYLHLLAAARQDPASTAAAELAWLLGYARWSGDPPDTLDDALLAALQRALLESRSRLAVFLSSDLLGLPVRFNLPGSYGIETWSERMPCPFPQLVEHPQFAARIATAAALIRESGRGRGGVG